MKYPRTFMAALVAIGVTLLCTYLAWLFLEWGDAHLPDGKEEVDVVIWDEFTGSLCASGWKAVDTNLLEQDEYGRWYYPTYLHLERRYPDSDPPSTHPPVDYWLLPRNHTDYSAGDRYVGRLRPWECDPPADITTLMAFMPFVLVAVGFWGWVSGVWKREAMR